MKTLMRHRGDLDDQLATSIAIYFHEIGQNFGVTPGMFISRHVFIFRSAYARMCSTSYVVLDPTQTPQIIYSIQCGSVIRLMIKCMTLIDLYRVAVAKSPRKIDISTSKLSSPSYMMHTSVAVPEKVYACEQ